VLLSHDHYDHLDKAAIKQLAGKVEHFLAPLGVGDLLAEWGVEARKITQLDWWQSATVGAVTCTATPAQHFSGRGARDSNKRLWCSWTVVNPDFRIFFSGDSGYFAGFGEIGQQYGPFDLTLVETGAYDRNWVDVHMLPEDSLQAHLDLRGKCMLPIHNGTFDLSIHPWYEPFERVYAAAQKARVHLATPRMGQAVSLANPPATDFWWRELLEADLVEQFS
jgi:L-ascorbate metabolism protein UlaG (beta-lactamase superfamily)